MMNHPHDWKAEKTNLMPWAHAVLPRYPANCVPAYRGPAQRQGNAFPPGYTRVVTLGEPRLCPEVG